MPEGLRTPDGQPVKVEPAPPSQEFARALAAPPAADIPAPPEPVPRDEAKPRRGRPPGSGVKKPDEAVKGKAAKPPAAVKSDYTQDISAIVTAAWMVSASLPPTAGYALVLHNSSDALVSALNEGAKKNATIRAFVSAGGDAAWWVPLAGVAAQMGIQGYQLYRDPELREQAAEVTKQQLSDMIKAQAVKAEQAPDAHHDVQ